jgi:MYXO-CTERM domain-containing protein
VRSDGDDPTPGMHWIIGLLALVSLLVWRWLPTQSAAPPDVNGRRSLHTEH